MGNWCQYKGAGGASWSQDPWGQDQQTPASQVLREQPRAWEVPTAGTE